MLIVIFMNDLLGDFGVRFGRMAIIYAFIGIRPEALFIMSIFGGVLLLIVDKIIEYRKTK